MRTTLTLESDVAALLRRLLKSRGTTLKRLVNSALRAGLRQLDAPPSRERFATRTADLGRCRVASIDDVAEALATAEGDRFR